GSDFAVTSSPYSSRANSTASASVMACPTRSSSNMWEFYPQQPDGVYHHGFSKLQMRKSIGGKPAQGPLQHRNRTILGGQPTHRRPAAVFNPAVLVVPRPPGFRANA